MSKRQRKDPALPPPVPGSMPRWARELLTRARQRARRENIPFQLGIEDIVVLYERCEGVCAVSGLPFTEERFDRALVKRPFAPSLDRINPHKGYTLDNARLVCTAANFAMNQWGHEVLQRIAYGLVTKEREPARKWRQQQRRKLRQYEQIAQSMAGEELVKQRQRIVGLKRAITLGPVKLSTAARRADRTRRRKKQGT